MKSITIITPTYNRAHLLAKAYNSLLQQTSKDFVWMIIDDGSVDDTKILVDSFIKEDKINIEYFYQMNGGKHRALNFAFKKLKTKLAIILDSDDSLTSDAISSIIEIDNKYDEVEDIFGFVFLKGIDIDNPVSTKFKCNEVIANYNEYIINSNVIGDKCEVFYSNILSKHSFNEYPNEKFIAEGYLWSNISNSYDMVFINKVIYICDYLEDGLTKAGRTLRLRNPLGGKRHAEEYLNKKYNFKIRVKNAMLYIIYSKLSNTKIWNNRNKWILIISYIPAIIIYNYWKIKYLKAVR